jgi:hypothetical protein
MAAGDPTITANLFWITLASRSMPFSATAAGTAVNCHGEQRLCILHLPENGTLRTLLFYWNIICVSLCFCFGFSGLAPPNLADL